MKMLFLVLPCVALAVAVTGCSQPRGNENAVAPPTPPSDLVAQIYFAGGEQISADTNSLAFTNLWCSPEAQALRAQTLNQLALAPYELLRKRIATPSNNGVRQFRPLLDDLLQSEWFLDVRDATNGPPEPVLAIHLNTARAQFWQTNLADILETWTALPVKQIPDGWELKKHLPPNRIRFVRAGDWVVLGCGQDELPLNDEIVRRVLAEKRPGPVETNSWLSADADWPRLARWFSWTNAVDWPTTRLQISARDGNLRWDGKFIYPQPLKWQLEPWQFPTNLIHQPMVSFTAMRGVRSWLAEQSRLTNFSKWLPDQIFVWALAGVPLQTFAAAPVTNATNALQELDEKLLAPFNTNLQSRMLGSFLLATNGAEINWRGLPFITPFVQADREPAGEFLFAGLFPDTPDAQPLPPALFTELSRTNLVYYDWEVTAERLSGVLNVSQLALMLAQRQQLDAQSAADKWLLHRVGTTPNSTVTEITQTAPDELTFKRSAPAGFTAAELIVLAHWLEAADFPVGGFHLPPRVEN
jgi:hypothetical protein